MDQPKIRGFFTRSVNLFVERSYDPPLRQRILDAVPAEVRAAAPSADRNAWYPLEYITGYWGAIDKVLGDRERTRREIQRCGEFVATEATNTFLKLLIKVLSPKMFARQFPDVWRRWHDFGDVDVDTSEVDGRRMKFACTGYDYAPFIGRGFLVHMFTMLGKDGLVIEDNCPPDQIYVPVVRWTVSWR